MSAEILSILSFVIFSTTLAFGEIQVPDRPEICDVKIKDPNWVKGNAILSGAQANKFFNMPGDVYFMGFPKNNKNKMAITLDDGPNETYMIEALDFLKEFNDKNPENPIYVTFFLLGERVENAKNAINRAVLEGHEIQTHGWDQDKAWTVGKKLTPEQVVDITCKVRQSILDVLTPEALDKLDLRTQLAWVRPPFGRISRKQAVKLGEYGFKISIPTVMPGALIKDEDGITRFKEPTSLVMPRIVANNHKKGRVLVLHTGEYVEDYNERTWDSPCMAQTLKEISKQLSHIKFLTISDLKKSSDKIEASGIPACPEVDKN